MTQHFFHKIADVQYHLTVAGRGETILFLHGFTGSGQNWAGHFPFFTERGFQCVAVDILGHGLSDAPLDFERYGMERVAGDIAGIFQHQPTPVHLVGYSMGGRLALYLAVHYPHLFQTVTLESASPGLATAEARQTRQQADDTLADWIELHGMEAFVDRWEQLGLWASQEKMPAFAKQQLRAQRLTNRVHGLANSLRGMGTGVQPSLWGELAGLKMPAFILAGSLDEKYVAIGKQMADLIPINQFQVLEGVGHTGHWEMPALFNQTIHHWLQKHP
jgi:2-succinyl-6-hydroxy-2,4-cyclohexadiene-1-carboxylate synthase